MKQKNRIYISIDLKSFYASVECMERNLDPMTTNLVVADPTRTEKTICLAVSPSLKSYGIPGRPRLFEVIQRVNQVNQKRKKHTSDGTFTGSSYVDPELKADADLALDYVIAPPRMAYYMEYSTKIYHIYLKYIAPEDIHVYSIDEVFCDVTDYLDTYQLTPRQLAAKMIQDVYETVGITATAGIGTNLYLAKIAMDILAKHAKPDDYGVRIAQLDEQSYRRLLWNHQPLTDFWRVGGGYQKKLHAHGLYTMGDIARCSLGSPQDFYNEELLYKLFGVNAELLIDHAWGIEPCTIKEIKDYKPENNSLGIGQVLTCPYDFEGARLVVQEMADMLSLDLVDKRLVTDQMVLTVGYDIENLNDPERRKKYGGEVTTDRYGRKIPKHAHGSKNLKSPTSSTKEIIEAVLELFKEICDPGLLVRRLNLTANHVVRESSVEKKENFVQLDLFTDYQAEEKKRKEEETARAKERNLQLALLDIKKKYGKNAVLKGMSLQEGATARSKNRQIGGHKA